MSSLRIIGLAGTAGAGKDTAAQLLCQMFNMQNLSTSDALRDIARYIYRLPADAMPVREQLFEVGTYLRTTVNPATLVQMCVLQAQVLQLERAIISGLRSMGEAEAILAAGGTIVAVDADSRVRYQRMFSRARDADAQKTLEEFLEQDERENKGISDRGSGRGISSIIASADIVITNNVDVDALQLELKHKIGPLLQ
jgi:dephospho-CoA kinase